MIDKETVERLETEIQEKFDDLVAVAIEKKLKELVDNPEQVAEVVYNSSQFHDKLYSYFNHFVGNEVGNRLRCGIYDGRKIDELFNKVWTQELEKALEDRIHKLIEKKLLASVTDTLANLKKLVEKI